MRGWCRIGTIVLLIFALLSLFTLSTSVQAPSKQSGDYVITYELLSNTDYCLSDCSLKFRFMIDQDYTIDNSNKFRKEFKKVKGNPKLIGSGFRLGETEKYNITIWNSNIVCNPYNITANGTITELQNCTDMGHYESQEKERLVYKDFNPLGKTFEVGKWYYIELWGRKEPKLGDDIIDAIPILGEFEFPFANWTSYEYGHEILSNATSVMPINVNDTYTPNIWTLNATEGEKKYLYCAVSGCTDNIWAMGNETDETPWEDEPPAEGHNPTAVWDDDTVAVYHLDNAAKDSSKYNNDLTGSEQWASGIFGNAFDATGQHNLNIGDTHSLSITEDITIAGWFYPTFAGVIQKQVVTKQIYNGQMSYLLRLGVGGGAGGSNEFSISRNGFYHGRTNCQFGTVIPNQWNFIVGTYDGSQLRGYINGEFINSKVHSGGIYDGTAPLILGGVADTLEEQYEYEGLIDDVRIYNRSLSQAEIIEMYYNGIDNLTELGPEESLNTTPNVTIHNATGSTKDNTPSIDFSYTDDDLYANCSLFLNDTLYANNESVLNATRTTLTVSSNLTPDDDEVVVNCSDGENIGESNHIILRILETIPPVFSDYKINKTPNEDEDVELNVTIIDEGGGSVDTVMVEITINSQNAVNYMVKTNVSDEWYFILDQGNYSAHDHVEYYWHANDTADNWGTSEQQYFVVENQKPHSPHLYRPEDGSDYAMGSTIDFIWNNSYDADEEDVISYILEISSNPAFPVNNRVYLSDPIAEGEAGSTEIGINLEDYTTQDGNYYWRVAATDSYENSTLPEIRSFQYANWTITFSLIDSVTFEQISTHGQTTFDISCNNGLNVTDLDNPYTAVDAFTPNEWQCTFSDLKKYYDKRINFITFTADQDKTVNVPMYHTEALTTEEHEWLEWLFNCWYSGKCNELLEAINLTTTEINETVGRIWNQEKRTDQSVVVTEDIIKELPNITINYSIDVPIKEGYTINDASGNIRFDYLPIKISYWFLDYPSNQTCFSQGNHSDAEPHCEPLMVYTIGQINTTISFIVNLRPSLPPGNYTIIRSIEIDPEQVWINYGHEVIGIMEVLEENDIPSISLRNTGAFFGSTDVSGIAAIGSAIADVSIINIISLAFSILAIGLLTYFYIHSRKGAITKPI